MTEHMKILFCTDFSRHAGDAFKHACGIATMSGGDLYVPHVVPSWLDYEKFHLEEGSPRPFSGESKVFERLEKSHSSTCRAPVKPVIRYGREAERVVEPAKSKGVDLIVMGARGVGFIEGLHGGGSVADKVVKNADVPVMLVP